MSDRNDPTHDPETGEISDGRVMTPAEAERSGMTISQQASVIPTGDMEEAIRSRKTFTTTQLKPDEQWITREVVLKGKGTKALLGKVVGVVRSWEPKETEYQGRIIPSICLKGEFRSENYQTGEIQMATSAYLPLAYAEQVAAVFRDNPQVRHVSIDCDIGVEATGKKPDYEWVVVAYLEGEQMATLRNMARKRPRPAWTQPALTLPTAEQSRAAAGLPAPERTLEPLNPAALPAPKDGAQ